MSHVKSTAISGWDQVISESQAMLDRVEAKAQRLKTNIEVMKEAKASGEPWPNDEQVKRQLSEQQHSA